MKRRFFVGLVSVIALVGSVLAVAAAEKVKGVTDTEVAIGQWGPQTGPAALWGAVARGSGVFFEMINDEGGINGRKIKYYLRDDAYQPAQTKAIAKEFVEQIGIFAVVGGVGTSSGMAVRDYLMENKVPWVAPSSGSTHWIDPFQKYLFSVYPLYWQESYLIAQYTAEKIGKKKIAFFYQNDDYGKQGLDGAKKYAAEKGMSLVAEVPVEVTDTDLKSHALKLKEAGAEAVILWVLPKHAAIILGASKAAGFQPQWMASSTLSDSKMMFEVTKGLWKDVIYANFLNMESPLIQKYLAATEKYAPQEKYRGVFYLAGFLWAEPLAEGLRRAGKDLTPDSLVKAMETIKDWNNWLGHDCTFTPEDHQGMKSVYLAKCGDQGKSEKISDWLTYKGK